MISEMFGLDRIEGMGLAHSSNVRLGTGIFGSLSYWPWVPAFPVVCTVQNKYVPVAVPNEAMKVSQPTYTSNRPMYCSWMPRTWCRCLLPHRLFGCPEYSGHFGEKKLPLVDEEPIAGLVAVSPEGKLT